MLVQDQRHRTGSPAQEALERVEQLAGAVLALGGGDLAVEEHALLGEASRVPSPSARNSTVVSETEISRPSCQQVVGEDDPLVVDDVVEAAAEHAQRRRARRC